MILFVYDKTGDKVLESEIAEPVCGEDFCDTCGDCLACYGDDLCTEDDFHFWVRYG